MYTVFVLQGTAKERKKMVLIARGRQDREDRDERRFDWLELVELLYGTKQYD